MAWDTSLIPCILRWSLDPKNGHRELSSNKNIQIIREQKKNVSFLNFDEVFGGNFRGIYL